MSLSRNALTRISRSVKVTERMNRTDQLTRRKRRGRRAAKAKSVCVSLQSFPIDTLTDGNSDYFIGLKNDGSGNYTCVRVLAEDCP